MKAILNDEGKRIWGYVFPNGEVPIKGTSSFKAQVEGKGEIEVYLVDLAALSQNEIALILDHLKNRFNNSEAEVESEIMKSGLPLRASLVSCVAIPARFL